MRYNYDYNGQTYAFDLQRQPDGSLQVIIGDETYRVTASEIESGAWLLYVDEQRYLAHTASDHDAHYVHLNGVQYRLEKTENRRRSQRSTGGTGGLTAEMPGQVLEVRVAEGDSVTSGQVLIVLEAMKMEIRVSSPIDGIVKKILVTAGQVVERGQILAEVDVE